MARNLGREFVTSTNGPGASAADWTNRAFWGRLDTEVNVGRTERWLSGAAGAALLAYGLGHRRFRALLLPAGIGLLARAITGRSEINRVLGRNSAWDEGRVSPVASLDRGEGRKIEQAVTIHRPRGELFRFWRQLDNLPRFMDNLESVTVLDSRRSHWVAKGPAGHACRVGCGDPQRDRGRAHRLALPAGRRRGSGRLGPLSPTADGQPKCG